MPQRRRASPPAPQPPGGELDLFPLEEGAPTVPDPSQLEPSVYDEVGELFPGASAAAAVSVSTLTATARDVVEGAFPPLWVRGEVTGFKAHRNGHWYFTLRDQAAQLRCAVWSRDRRGIPAQPDEGMQVAAFGQLTVYHARGEMQFTVQRLEAEGDGLWRKALELTRRKLEADGLLAPERKRAIPAHPRCIAVITSPDGAALHDISAVVRRRAPGVRVVLVPAAVQGDTAVRELRLALRRVARWGGADTVIIGRGGGAREDLWAFNDEKVCRAVAACPVPVISAVGHEIDLTICDLVADLRAPTPSAAAEAAVRASAELLAALASTKARLSAALQARLRGARTSLRRTGRHFALAARHDVAVRRASIESLAGRLDALSPVATLARGYAVARDEAGRTLSSVEQFAVGHRFELIVRDGSVDASALGTRGGAPGAKHG